MVIFKIFAENIKLLVQKNKSLENFPQLIHLIRISEEINCQSVESFIFVDI